MPKAFKFLQIFLKVYTKSHIYISLSATLQLPCSSAKKNEERHRDGVLKSTQIREDINVKTNIQIKPCLYIVERCRDG